MSTACQDEFLYTYDDYAQWEGDWELIDGVPIAMSPAPTKKHQGLTSELIFQLKKQLVGCAECEVFGEVDYKIDENTVVRPDVVLTCGDEGEAYLTKAPEIVVEIISPSTARKDEHHKFALYEAEKVPYYLLIYPEDLRAKLYKLDGNGYDKQGDFFKESYIFSGLGCEVRLDFDHVFRRYRSS